MKFTESLWISIEDIYDRILKHPFIRGLIDGSKSLGNRSIRDMEQRKHVVEFHLPQWEKRLQPEARGK
jgi:hypothetical protein